MGNTVAQPGAKIKFGHRVLEVTPGSPSAEALLVPYVDVIVAINDVPLDNEENSLVRMVVQNVNKSTKFTVYNMKMRKLRDCMITPRKGWGGAGVLGLVARYDSFSIDEDHVLFVKEIIPNSPAALAGLRAEEDVILGSEKLTFRSAAKFVDQLKKSMGQVLVMYVYNVPTDTVRPVAVVPHASWDGASNRNGAHYQLLGCGIVMEADTQLPSASRGTTGILADFSNVDIMGETNVERLGKLGNLMDRTVTQKATGSDLLDASIPLPPPPPPPLPGPPQHAEDDEADSDDDDFGLEDEEDTPAQEELREEDEKQQHSDEGGSEPEYGSDEDAGSGEERTSRRRRPKKPAVVNSAVMAEAIEHGARRTAGIGARMTRGAARKMSIAAAKKAAAAARGTKSSGEPIELIFKTKDQRLREEEQERKAFLSSNPMNV